MTRRKQHRRNRQDSVHALGPQGIEAITEHGTGEFEVTVFDGERGQTWSQGLHHLRKLLNGEAIATAMATDQDTELFVGSRTEITQGVASFDAQA